MINQVKLNQIFQAHCHSNSDLICKYRVIKITAKRVVLQHLQIDDDIINVKVSPYNLAELVLIGKYTNLYPTGEIYESH
ncbi:hypothetical protein [Gilliamella sp. ESL0250]|uniref:hypothetical protein n=1 Tax=Gilliamella sp. ESL0250 TaxID=2705036 RepID=UPI001580E2CB|nr:hypothetical protein [Gilliamella sp. ESL0250]NUF49508.1 hypothetical protein [Gilliamella sp. ESL0250]